MTVARDPEMGSDASARPQSGHVYHVVPFDDQRIPALHTKIKRGLVEYPVWLSAGMSLPSNDRTLAAKWSHSDPFIL